MKFYVQKISKKEQTDMNKLREIAEYYGYGNIIAILKRTLVEKEMAQGMSEQEAEVSVAISLGDL